MNELAIPSLGGGRLPGGNIVRVVYVDEAGRGLISEEPHFVVACAITNPDTQWHKLRRHYADIANDVFGLKGDDKYDEYVFHAKDVWHGSGDFPRLKFSLQVRMKIMNRLADVVRLYEIPICVGIIERQSVHEDLSSSKTAVRHLEHACAYALALQYVDSWMVRHCPDQVATVTAEDTDDVKQTLQLFHESAIKKDTYDDYYDRGFFVTKTIVDSVNFAPKQLSPLLQVADHCAFLAKRSSVGCKHAKDIWRKISPQLWTVNDH